MWTVVYMASDEDMINSVCFMLKDNEIIFRCRQIEKTKTPEDMCYEILVPDAEVFKAQELIFEAEIN